MCEPCPEQDGWEDAVQAGGFRVGEEEEMSVKKANLSDKALTENWKGRTIMCPYCGSKIVDEPFVLLICKSCNGVIRKQ